MDETTTLADDTTQLLGEDTLADAELVDDELLIEEISIDGMCGVY